MAKTNIYLEPKRSRRGPQPVADRMTTTVRLESSTYRWLSEHDYNLSKLMRILLRKFKQKSEDFMERGSLTVKVTQEDYNEEK
jgi:hypothetical protein